MNSRLLFKKGAVMKNSFYFEGKNKKNWTTGPTFGKL